MKLRLAILGLVLTLSTACNQQTTASLWRTAGQLADNYIAAYFPSWDGRTAFDAAWAKAQAAIEGWKAGSPCSAVLTAVNDGVAIFDTIPTVTQNQKLLLSTIAASITIVADNFASCAPHTAGPVIHRSLPPTKSHAATASKELLKQWKALGGPTK